MSVYDLPPAEFREKIRDGIHRVFSPTEFQTIRRMYEEDGTDALERAARDQLPDDLEDADQYVDAMAEAFRLEMEADDA